jgi:hypothetical protein
MSNIIAFFFAVVLASRTILVSTLSSFYETEHNTFLRLPSEIRRQQKMFGFHISNLSIRLYKQIV